MNYFSSLFITIIYLLNKSSSKIIFDNINTNINWLYLTKFSFHPIHGHIDINLNSFNDTIKIFIFNKEEWKEIKKDLPTICLKKELILNQVINETNSEVFSSFFTATGQMHFILRKCNSTWNNTDLAVKYKLLLTNGNDLFTKHFSDDERGILELFIISTSIYTINLLAILRCTCKSCLVMKLFFISILFSWLNYLISLIYTLVFALVGNIDAFIFRLLIFLAHLFYLTARILFLLVLILCAKGYLIRCVQLKKRIIGEIILIILIYTNIQIVILIIITIFADRIFDKENIFIICDYIQFIMYLLTCLWFVVSVLITIKQSKKKFYVLLIFSIWFLANAIVILLNILDVLPNPQITIIKAIEISIQYLTYGIFMFIIRQKTFFLRTKLNQINITYIAPTSSNSYIPEQSIKGTRIEINRYELTNLCSIENAWTSRFRMLIKPSGSLPRLEPRRDISSKTFTKSSMISSPPSICLVPRRLTPLKHINQ